MHDKISLSCAQSSSIPISKVYLYGSFLRYNEIVKSTVYREQNLHLVKMSNARELAEIHIQDTNLKLEREARDTFFFSTARTPFFLTPLCHSSFTAEILYPLFLPYSLFIIGISFSMSEQLFSFFLNFLLHRPLSRIHFIPWILVFPLFYSPRHSPRSFFFFEFFAFLRCEFEYLYSPR